MATVNDFDLAEEQLKAFTRSAVRTKIMLCLMDRELSGGDLEKEMDIRVSTILHSMKEMIDDDLAKRTPGGYSLTNIGKIQALLLDELVSAIVALDQRKGFWLSHDLRSIPNDLLSKIGKISQSQIMEADPSALLKVAEHAIAEMVKAKEIYGLSPIIVPGFSEAIAKAVRNGANVNLILTNDIIKEVKKHYYNTIKDLLSRDNFKLYLFSEEVKIAFTVIDSLLSLGLYRTDGGYDLGEDLICIGAPARSWGLELFEYYKKRSLLVEAL
jgi:predicted transcriptional regulator